MPEITGSSVGSGYGDLHCCTAFLVFCYRVGHIIFTFLLSTWFSR